MKSRLILAKRAAKGANMVHSSNYTKSSYVGQRVVLILIKTQMTLIISQKVNSVTLPRQDVENRPLG